MARIDRVQPETNVKSNKAGSKPIVGAARPASAPKSRTRERVTGQDAALEKLVAEIRACRICKDQPTGKSLAHEPRPILQIDSRARLAISGQAPGTRVHASGQPFTDPSGDRLRQWMGIGCDAFYDPSRIAIIPMGFCFPGQDGKGGDLPPRPECAPRWRQQLLNALPNIEVMLLVGQYAQRWHLGGATRRTLTENVKDWRAVSAQSVRPRFYPLPHPSWRNNAWLKSNPWFEDELLPLLRKDVRRLLE